ncbi:type I-MYXAN CRISPR-associated protein Cmx8 [Spirulina sp. CS-785/01]|uniref:type I-MYXAN CRISPR-associated protein Cmx8 n=1 Tax=Spirulina sp. CS-785/01 TaxID=3021716 RepID=UPI00232A7B84|nr:type I-MYXAN CRISPR-associated protein Cmx8 [Spirulina sp. CS-785/01]MDB9311782.1 type I-MYXAN CRISPR-associated protein Cmx8 [Spirulina sp. CS-785/01]
MIELTYHLAELPSVQHRAGLAGLVLMVQELSRYPEFADREGVVLEFSELEDPHATLQVNEAGLQALFDFTYSATLDERHTDKKIKKYDRVEEIETTDKKGKPKTIQRYYYSVVVPKGAFLADWDKSGDENNAGLWIKLWRDMLWTIIRGIPTTRKSYDERVEGKPPYTKDVTETWKALQTPEKLTGQRSQYYLGAMTINPENIPTQDTVAHQFLLHFWVYVAQVYCPAILNKDGKREISGYVLAIPDVANLVDFCDEFKDVLNQREPHSYGYRPREAIIDLPEEGGLELMRLMCERISRRTGNQTLADLILGVEVIHAEKVGNVVKIRSLNYVEPLTRQVDRYAEIKKAYWCPWFRKQRLLNLLHSTPESPETDAPLQELPAWLEFDALLSRIPRKWLQDPYFNHDARELFKNEIPQNGENAMTTEIRHYAEIVYRVCQHYVLSKLNSKYGLDWKECQGKPKKEQEYNDKKTKIANDAFLAVRSRTEAQIFIEYFVSTLYPYIRKEEFPDFAETLFNQTHEIRALTLLGLSSQFSSSKKTDQSNTSNNAA